MSRGRARLRWSELAEEQARLLADAIRATPGARLVGHRSAEGDRARQRGIPIQAPGVGGTMLGTRPDGWIDRMRDDCG